MMNLRRGVLFALGLLCLSAVVAYADDDMSTEQEMANKAVMNWIYANGVNAHNPDAWDSVLTSDYVRHCEAMPPEAREIHGIDAMKTFLAGIFKAFPDWHEDVVHMIAEGDMVALITHGSGTMKNPLGEFPATGQRAEVTNIMMMRFEDGKVAETWITWDNLYFLEQVGLLQSMMKQPPGADTKPSGKDSD